MRTENEFGPKQQEPIGTGSGNSLYYLFDSDYKLICCLFIFFASKESIILC